MALFDIRMQVYHLRKLQQEYVTLYIGISYKYVFAQDLYHYAYY